MHVQGCCCYHFLCVQHLKLIVDGDQHVGKLLGLLTGSPVTLFKHHSLFFVSILSNTAQIISCSNYTFISK